MIEGALVLWDGQKIYASKVFVGHMQPTSGLGGIAYEKLKSISTKDDFLKFVKYFNDNYFGGYDDPIDVQDIFPENIMQIGVWYPQHFSDTGLQEFYLYFRNISKNPVTILDHNNYLCICYPDTVTIFFNGSYLPVYEKTQFAFLIQNILEESKHIVQNFEDISYIKQQNETNIIENVKKHILVLKTKSIEITIDGQITNSILDTYLNIHIAYKNKRKFIKILRDGTMKVSLQKETNCIELINFSKRLTKNTEDNIQIILEEMFKDINVVIV